MKELMIMYHPVKKEIRFLVDVHGCQHKCPHPFHGDKQVGLATGVGSIDDCRSNDTNPRINLGILAEPFLTGFDGAKIKRLLFLERPKVFNRKTY